MWFCSGVRHTVCTLTTANQWISVNCSPQHTHTRVTAVHFLAVSPFVVKSLLLRLFLAVFFDALLRLLTSLVLRTFLSAFTSQAGRRKAKLWSVVLPGGVEQSSHSLC